MKEVKGRFLERIERTHNVASFRLAVEDKIDFVPGQFVQVIFDEKDRQNKNLNKYLSFSCAPGKDYVEVTKKISESEFSKCLTALKAGEQVLLKAPLGNCTFNPDYQKIGFLVGGIGITPAISIIEYVAEKKLNTDVSLIYSNWTMQDIAFKKELDEWSKANKNIKVTYTLVNEKPCDGCIRCGVITEDFLKEYAADFDQRICFIYGPPGMVNAMKDLCQKAGLNKDAVKAETFIGY